jgi:hypothetical protein
MLISLKAGEFVVLNNKACETAHKKNYFILKEKKEIERQLIHKTGILS